MIVHAADRSPTRPSAPGLTPLIERNVQALSDREAREIADAKLWDRIADKVTRFTGSMTFVFLHVVLFGFWIIANLGGIPGVPRWDASFVVLAMFASVEAIFLSTFVLISQNRMATVAEKRAHLALQISLLTEHEITRLSTVIADIARRLGIETDAQFDEVEKDVAPEAVLDRIEAEKR